MLDPAEIFVEQKDEEVFNISYNNIEVVFIVGDDPTLDIPYFFMFKGVDEYACCGH